MTRLSEYLLPTEKQAPADAEALSHKLMVRAGLVRQVGAGLWTWLPAGWRVHQKVVQIVREEIDAIGGQEMLMPVLQPGRAVEALPAATTSTSCSSSRTARAPSMVLAHDARGGRDLPRRRASCAPTATCR